jgi:predicted transposase/invertase (TIGR01784 family)
MEFIPLWERDSHEEGIKKGEKLRAKETAKKMLSDDFPVESITKYTGLSQKEIKALMH